MFSVIWFSMSVGTSGWMQNYAKNLIKIEKPKTNYCLWLTNNLFERSSGSGSCSIFKPFLCYLHVFRYVQICYFACACRKNVQLFCCTLQWKNIQMIIFCYQGQKKSRLLLLFIESLHYQDRCVVVIENAVCCEL